MHSARRIHHISKKKVFFSLLSILSIVALVIFFCNQAVEKSAKGKLFDDTSSIPFNKVGLLLGTSKYIATGLLNPYYVYRIEAAVSLIHAGKIKYLIVSGDNSRKDYSEPELMRTDLVRAGIDSSIIFLDYAGFRTYDSMVRLKEIFGQDSVTIISQSFHNARAIYIASRERITAIGFNAKDVEKRFGFRVQLREKFARTKVFLDYAFGKKPRFLGKKIIIPD